MHMNESGEGPIASDEELDEILRLTDQFSRPQAIKKVLGNERARRFMAAEARYKIEQSAAEAQAEREARDTEAKERHREETLRLMRGTDPDSNSDSGPA